MDTNKMEQHLEEIAKQLKEIKEMMTRGGMPAFASALQDDTPAEAKLTDAESSPLATDRGVEEEDGGEQHWPKAVLAKFKSWFKKDSPYIIPASIVIAGLLVAGVMAFGSGGEAPGTAGTANTGQIANAGNTAKPSDNIQKITDKDHIRGNAKAPVKVVEFSDFDCPFCQRFHPTMQQVLEEFGDQVAWVYRHFPLESIHPKAKEKAAASECVAELGGNEKFWQFTDLIFESSQDGNPQELAALAGRVGINQSQFLSCLSSDKYDELIASHTRDAQNSGGRGTPYSVVIAPDGSTLTINGAQPYTTVKATIERALQNK